MLGGPQTLQTSREETGKLSVNRAVSCCSLAVFSYLMCFELIKSYSKCKENFRIRNQKPGKKSK